MKKLTYILFIFILSISCDTPEEIIYYPANPPMDINLVKLTAGNHGGAYIDDYLLLFRSANNANTKFGGFFIFIDADQAIVLQMTNRTDADYVLGLANGESTLPYNPADGINARIAILFTSKTAPATIDYNSNIYTLAKVLLPTNLISGNWFTMRSYLCLWDGTQYQIIEVSEPGNPVQIP
ncbi:MAG: hypothetical protein V1874_16395 [Spirochaetota bacterium]